VNVIADTGFAWNGGIEGDGYQNYRPNHPKFRSESRPVGPNEIADLEHSAPSSEHPGQFGVLYADGHVEVVNDDIEPEVYLKAVCPNDKLLDKVKVAGGFSDDWDAAP
jgi:prepilin-type processing-associated H-X9-DG protein